MRVGIFGAGAIGGLMAAKLTRAGADVTVIARGPHLAAMQSRGILLRTNGEEFSTHPRCVADAAEAGVQDYVVVTLKAHSLPGAAPQIAKMMGPHSALVTGINGVPYWYFHSLDGPFENRTVDSVDPGGIVSRILPPACAIGCVVYPAAEVPEPGIIDHGYGDRFTLGEPDGTRTPRIERLSTALIEAGFKAPIRPRIRDEIWVKLWGNMAFNPVSALTGATLVRLAEEPSLRTLIRALMVEGRAVGEALGIKFGIDVDKRIAGAAEVGEHKTSMLQDLERGRPMEIDALLGAVVELGELVGHEMPTARTVLALVRERGRQAGCYT